MAARDTLVLPSPHGEVRIALRRDAAPQSCEAMERLAALFSGQGRWYRSEPHCLQGGLHGSGVASPVKIPLEQGLPNAKWTVALARWDDPGSAAGEFFVNLRDNHNLDRTGDSGWALGFAVIGEVEDEASREAVRRIAALPTVAKGGMKLLEPPVVFGDVRVEKK